jgi:hypothetical protein
MPKPNLYLSVMVLSRKMKWRHISWRQTTVLWEEILFIISRKRLTLPQTSANIVAEWWVWCWLNEGSVIHKSKLVSCIDLFKKCIFFISQLWGLIRQGFKCKGKHSARSWQSVPLGCNISMPYACVLKAHSRLHSKSGGSIWASLECQCWFWIAGGLVDIRKQHWHSRESLIEPPLFECEWAFRIQVPLVFSGQQHIELSCFR